MSIGADAVDAVPRLVAAPVLAVAAISFPMMVMAMADTAGNAMPPADGQLRSASA